jgi:hypothetical protein
MSQFALVYRNGQRDLSLEEMQRHISDCEKWFNDLLARGCIKDRGVPLGSDQSAVVSKHEVIHDGPFSEAKDLIGGFTLVEAADLAEAIRIAKTCPVVDVGGSVEVRPVQSCTS